jgi:hypothetical protein
MQRVVSVLAMRWIAYMRRTTSILAVGPYTDLPPLTVQRLPSSSGRREQFPRRGLLSDSSAPGYGRIWRLPVSFTIDRQGLLAEDGWKEKKPAWTRERLDQLAAPRAPPRRRDRAEDRRWRPQAACSSHTPRGGKYRGSGTRELQQHYAN